MALWKLLVTECASRGLQVPSINRSGNRIKVSLRLLKPSASGKSSELAWQHIANVNAKAGNKETFSKDFENVIQQMLAITRKIPIAPMPVAEMIAHCHAASLQSSFAKKWKNLKEVCAKEGFSEPTWSTVSAKQSKAIVTVCLDHFPSYSVSLQNAASAQPGNVLIKDNNSRPVAAIDWGGA
eukprot:tig00021314_g20113.t1